MKLKSHFLLVLFTVSFFIEAQSSYSPGSFVIKGHVKNFKESFIDFGMTTYFDNSSNSIVVNSNGSFEQKFPVEKQQEFFLYLNEDTYLFTVLENDILTIEWDNSDFNKTFSIKGSNTSRTKSLQMQMNLHDELIVSARKEYQKMCKENKKLNSQEKFSLINELYNSNVKKVLDSSAESFSEPINDIITGLYFQYTILLNNERLQSLFPPIEGVHLLH